MAANSKHNLDVLEWLYKVINSCVTIHQVSSAKRLIGLYCKRYPSKIFGDNDWINHEVLIVMCDHKWDECIKKLYPRNLDNIINYTI